MTDEEYLEWGGCMFGNCIDCAFVGDGLELNDLGYCYQQCRMVKPTWGCIEFEPPKEDAKQ